MAAAAGAVDVEVAVGERRPHIVAVLGEVAGMEPPQSKDPLVNIQRRCTGPRQVRRL